MLEWDGRGGAAGGPAAAPPAAGATESGVGSDGPAAPPVLSGNALPLRDCGAGAPSHKRARRDRFEAVPPSSKSSTACPPY